MCFMLQSGIKQGNLTFWALCLLIVRFSVVVDVVLHTNRCLHSNRHIDQQDIGRYESRKPIGLREFPTEY